MPEHPKGEQYARLLLTTIREIRDEHAACTSREIARRLQVTHPLVNRQLDTLRKAGLVSATSMPGSIHLTPRGGKVASGAPMPELPTKERRVPVRDRSLAEPERPTRPTAPQVPVPAAWPPPPPPA